MYNYYAYTYDALGRVSKTTAVEATDGTEFYTFYEYLTSSDTGNSVSLVSKVSYKITQGDVWYATVGSIEYTYDRNGFITSVTVKDANGTVTDTESYTYDALGQLTRVVNGTDVTEYTYDNSGNILTKKVNGTVVGSYTYGDSEWKDLLTAYNGTTITYDGIGNPTSYIGWDNLTWSMGRRLTSLTNEANNVTYSYDAAGQRISKTVNGVTTEFYYDDRGALVLSSCSNGTDIYFYPDADGSIGSIGYNGNRYYYVRNAQNDIIGITDKTGAFVAKYTYDEWGNITSITDGNGNDVSGNPNHIANLNPLRYRSYFYDAETGWYWLNTRYYNPVVGRFLNADSYASTGQGVIGHNMFAYCGNNPVNMVDYTGELALSIAAEKALEWLIGGAVAALCTAIPEVKEAIGEFVTDIADAVSDALTVEKEEADSKAEEKGKKESAIYYGIDLRENKWEVVTGPMTLDEAIVWVGIQYIKKDFKKSSKWGVYTKDFSDADKIATALGGGEPPLWHRTRPGCYAHFHVSGHDLFGYYKSFHMWYGEKGRLK